MKKVIITISSGVGLLVIGGICAACASTVSEAGSMVFLGFMSAACFLGGLLLSIVGGLELWDNL